MRSRSLALDTRKPEPADAGLRVGWTNETARCDAVEGERKDALSPCAVVFSAADADTSHDDFTAIENINDTYRSRRKKGGACSPCSLELSANPRGL